METPSESFRLAVKDSWHIAKKLNSNAITSAHILLAILQQKESNSAITINKLVKDSTEFQKSVSDAAFNHGAKEPQFKLKTIFNRKASKDSIELSDEAERIVATAMKTSSNRNESASIFDLVVCMLENSDSVAFSALSNHFDIAHLKSELQRHK